MAGLPLPGVDLIKTFEGCRLAAYPDPKTGGKPITIGWGSTRKKDGSPFQLGDRLTQQEADDLLIWQLEREFLPPQARIPGWDSWNEQQQGAILSFAYNLGARFYGAGGFETISRVLRNREWSQIERALVMYRNPGSNVEEGLLRRRLYEARVFLSGTPGVDLSDAAQKYLSGGRTPSGSRLSKEAQAYLAGGQGGTAGGSTPQPPARRTLYLTKPYMQGADVIEAQRALIRRRAGIIADGIFGPATKTAVEGFQRAYGLVPDGVIGPKTWEVLLDRMLQLTTPNMVGEDVRGLQRALSHAGYAVAVDGVFGPGTERAVKQFQSSNGLTADGVVGPQTRTKLGI